MATRSCPKCNLDCSVDEFFQCYLCKRLAHVCAAVFKKNEINSDFVRRAALSGFKYICCSCCPTIDLFSNSSVNLQAKLDTLQTGIEKISMDVSTISNDMNLVKHVCNQSDFAVNDCRDSAPDKRMSYARAVKESTLMLTAKDVNVQSADLKGRIQNSISPEEDRITGLHATSSTKFILKSGNKDINSFVASVKSKLGQDFDVSIRDNDVKRIKVVRFVKESFSLDEIREAMLKQNEGDIRNVEKFKIVKELPDKKDARFSTLIIQLDSLSHRLLLDKGFVNAKWRKYKIFDAFTISRCYKCARFGHKIVGCPSNLPVCPKCSGSHKSDECTVTCFTCINCVEAKAKFNLDIDVSHPAYSLKCPTMLAKLKRFSQF